MPQGIAIIPMILLGLVFLTGLVNAINPRAMWKLFESWKAVREPTQAFFLLRRLGGVIAMLIAAGIILLPYIMSMQ